MNGEKMIVGMKITIALIFGDSEKLQISEIGSFVSEIWSFKVTEPECDKITKRL